MTFHDTRHDYITTLSEPGYPLHVISRIVGHRSHAITASRYSHLSLEHAERAATEIGDKLRKLCSPHGLTLPWFDENSEILKINIRRLDWHENDDYGKYIKIPGSMQCPAIYGDPSLKVGIILESEFDALLIQQEAGDFCFCIATGGSTQPLDQITDQIIRKCPLIMFCPDVDKAGAKFLERLQEAYTNGVLWPAPFGKSPGDAFADQGINLREWILQGCESFKIGQNK